MEFEFPRTLYDTPANLLSVLGSWWADEYEGRDQVSRIVQGKAQVEQQTVLDLLELIASMSRFSVPIYHRDNWFPFYLRESRRNDSSLTMLQYSSNAKYDRGFQYDHSVNDNLFAFPLPDNLVEAPMMFNRFTDPTVSLTQNLDYVITEDAVIFTRDPFTNPNVARRPVFEDGRQVDTEAILWVFQGDFEWESTYRQFGYVLGVHMESSANYRNLVNAVFDNLVAGTAKHSIIQAVSAMTGIPLVKESREVVVDARVNVDEVTVITDQTVYKFQPDANVTASVGDVLQRGAPLTDALRVYELNTGSIPEDLAALAMGEGFLATCYYSDLVFENKDVPLIVDETHESGFTKVSWPLGGFPLDVDAFFDDMHDRGVHAAQRVIDECDEVDGVFYPGEDCTPASGTTKRRGTIAHFLDQRKEQVGEPKANSLPRTINPLKFLIKNILRNNAYLVRVKAAGLGTYGVGLQNAQVLRKVVPPHTAMLLMLDLTAEKDSVTVDHVEERLSRFDAMPLLQEEIGTSFISDSRITIREITGSCH